MAKIILKIPKYLKDLLEMLKILNLVPFSPIICVVICEIFINFNLSKHFKLQTFRK